MGGNNIASNDLIAILDADISVDPEKLVDFFILLNLIEQTL